MAAAIRQRARQRRRPAPAYRGVQGTITLRNPNDLEPHPRNSRMHTTEQIQKVARSIRKFGFNAPVLVKGNVIVAGHARVDAAKLEGMVEVPTLDVSHLSDDEVRAYLIADNRHAQNASWDEDVLAMEAFELKDLGFDPQELGFSGDEDFYSMDGGTGGRASVQQGTPGALAARFGVPPVSVLSARDGWWRARKREWLSIGLASEEGRDHTWNSLASAYRVQNNLQGMSDDEVPNWATTSIFDPVLCELSYRWFCPPDGLVLDPYAGGSVRGIVAGKLGRRYIGIDLSERQVEANMAQRSEDIAELVNWEVGDSSTDLARIMGDRRADFVFTCPPYFDLEQYSEDARDVSNMDWETFQSTYETIIANTVAVMVDDSFAVFVIGDVRDRNGHYRALPALTIRSFQNAGINLYNEAILVTVLGTAPVRVAGQFPQSRKMCRTHQMVLVFLKGDPRVAAAKVGECEFGEIEPDPEDTEGGDELEVDGV